MGVPVAFYKIIVDEVPGQPRMLAFIMPQEVGGDEAPRRFLTSIDKIEEQTGLDFFTEMEKDQEARLEADVALDGWYSHAKG